MNIIYSLLILDFLIVIHELGHYLAARYTGLQVSSFSVGIGPSLLYRRHGKGTRWMLGLILVGGYVEIPGIDKANPLDKILVYLAGPLATSLLTVVLLFGVYWAGLPSDHGIVHIVPWWISRALWQDMGAALGHPLQLSGPIGIVSTMGEIHYGSMAGLREGLFYAAFINASLVVINLLPIPICDGGRAIIAFLEILGCDLGKKAKMILYGGSAACLLALMVYISYRDIVHLVIQQ